MAGYWFKVYVEILEDPKYSRWSDKAKLGAFELMAIAKRLQVGPEATGNLPSIEKICFYSRRSARWWQPVITELLTMVNPDDPDDKSFLIEVDGRLVIRKFKDRQKAVDAAARSRESRKRRAAVTNPDDLRDDAVTTLPRNVTEISEEDEDEEKEGDIETDEEVDNGGPTQSATELLIALERASKKKRPEDQIELAKWLTTLMDMKKAGIDADIIGLAVKELTAAGTYKIMAPWSIVKACNFIIERRARRDGPHILDSEGDFGKYINH
jgi:hypothetical protein